MTGQTPSIAERLCKADSPNSLLDWENKPGYYVTTCRVSASDVPSLIDIAFKWCDPNWPGNDLEEGVDRQEYELLPVAAWRALADLKSSESVEPLVDMLCKLDPDLDDWTVDELPHVFGKIGKPAIGAMACLARDANKPESIRSIAAESLQRVAEYDEAARAEVISTLHELIGNVVPDHINFNTAVLCGLVDLSAAEAAEAIERAFANDCLDVGMLGDWEDVRRELGVQGLGLQMPKHPHNSMEQFRRRVGIGIFSDRPMLADGEPAPEDEQAYYKRAWDLFSKSDEATQVVNRCDDLGWFRSLLDFGLNYCGEIVDEMSVSTIQEFVFDYVPRKVSTEPQEAASIIFELEMFWQYLDRVFELPEAKPIIKWLKTDGIAAELQADMSDPANFGMAKSIFMSGKKRRLRHDIGGGFGRIHHGVQRVAAVKHHVRTSDARFRKSESGPQ